MEIAQFLKSLKDVGSSPLALIGYVVVIGAWVTRAVLLMRPQVEAKNILQMYKTERERTKALRELIGNAPPPGLKDADIVVWVKVQASIQNKQLLLAAYISTLILATVLIGIAINQSVDRSTPVLERSTVTRP